MTEIWKPITGYENYYEVSNIGNIRSLDRCVLRSDGVKHNLKSSNKLQTLNPDGYLTVKLSKNGKDKRFGVHVLVAREFVSGYSKSKEVNHKDFDRTNNCADNLEWLTHKENIKYTINSVRHISQIRSMSGENNPNFGNNKLSIKYSNNKELAKEKQSRSGSKNGMSVPITLIFQNGERKDFLYMLECANYLVSNKLVKSKNANNVAAYISTALKFQKSYYGYNFLRK